CSAPIAQSAPKRVITAHVNAIQRIRVVFIKREISRIVRRASAQKVPEILAPFFLRSTLPVPSGRIPALTKCEISLCLGALVVPSSAEPGGRACAAAPPKSCGRAATRPYPRNTGPADDGKALA